LIHFPRGARGPGSANLSSMESAAHIAVVDDHREIRDLVGRYLVHHGYRVTVAAGAADFRQLLERSAFDLVVLDIMMPVEDGLTLCRHLRTTTDLPIILLTAVTEETDRIIGLEMGADDYVTKPFNPRELLARINAVLRRRAPAGPPGAPTATGEAHPFGNFVLNLSTTTLTLEGKTVPLTTGEFSVLKVLVQHPRQPLSRDKLMELARGREYEVFDRSIDVQISRLRKIVEDDPSHPKHIQTVWGFGYVFVPD